MQPRHSGELAQFRPRRRRRVLQLLCVLLVGLAIGAWCLPQIAVQEPIRGWLLAKALSGSPARIDFQSASLGWLSPLEINELTISDERETVVTVTRVTTTHTLLQMLTDARELGTIRLEAPVVHVVLDPQGENNVARLIGRSAPAEDSDIPSTVKLEVTDGRLIVTDQTQGREFVAENTALRATIPSDAAEPVEVHVSAIALDAGQQGSLHAQLKWWQPQVGYRVGQGNAQVQAEHFPITLATAMAGAAGIDVQGSGQVNATVECTWEEDAQGLRVPIKANITGSNVTLTLPQFQGDRIASQHVQVDLNAAAGSGKLAINQLHAASDFGTLEAQGEAPLQSLSAPAYQGVVAEHHLEVHGFVDLPHLAAQLPQTLKLREDAVVTQGHAKLLVSSSGQQGRHTIQAKLTTEQLAGTVAGRAVAWSEPATVDLTAFREHGPFTIEQATCRAPFGTIEVRGDAQGGSFSADSDLSAVVSQLGQFVDFGDLQLVGRAETRGNWKFDGDLLTMNVDSDYRGLSISRGSIPMMVEPELTTRADVRVCFDGQCVRRIESAAIQATSGADQLLVRLKQGVDAPGEDAVWPIMCRITGDLTQWTRRLSFDTPWELAGDARVEAEGWVSNSQLEIPSWNAEITNFVAGAGTTQIVEPTVQCQGSLRGNAKTKTLQLDSLQATSSIIAINSQDVRLSFRDGPLALSGVLAFRGDGARLHDLLDPTSPQRMTGTVDGQFSFEPSGNTIRIDGTVTTQQFALYAPAPVGQPAVFVEGQQVGQEQLLWNEQSLMARLKANWNPGADTAELELLQVAGDEGTLDLHGSVAELTRQTQLQLEGNLRYDLDRLSRKLNAERSSGIQLAGQHQSKIAVHGPLFHLPSRPVAGDQMPAAPRTLSPDLVAATSLAWDAANVYGIAVGPQQLNVELKQSVLSTSAINTALAGGQLVATPAIDFTQHPLAIDLAGETVLQNAQLSPEFCERWIKYVAPLLAGTTTASGDFSIVLNQARIPLKNPYMAEVAGRFVVGTARVQPGPLARSIYSIGGDFTTLLARGDSPFAFMAPDQSWLELSNQQVDFQMTEGRIYHQNLNIGVGDVVVSSRGWVGLDQSVAMVAEIPVQDKWLGSSPLLDGLRGQTVQVPIHGTLNRPQLDRRAISQLSSQLIGNTAERLIDGQLQKGLQKLLGPK